ncbi:antichymotrypsin-2 isoform X8 [Diabrotica virgifera virgifera]|uniref:Antichymotrypsin-2-like isoform X12 n=1 Tax=Diabrotica virgifera virgifera TaxID=50390 RepID=A0A6P7F4A3_DIAVI|nr:antichymotrypsin-2 isoform X8 [Diabrotica virgifera virgifera]
MGLVKVEDFGSRIDRLSVSARNFIHLVSNSVYGSQLFLVFVTFFLLSTSTFVMAEENKHLTAVLQGNGLFTRNAYQILAQEKGKNIFFSPISIHAILSLASQGSGGKTQKALTSALQVADIATLAEGYKAAMLKLNSVEDVTLLMANKVYVKNEYALKDEFKDKVVNHFFSEVQNVDFSQSAAAAKTINTWVEEKTKDKIKDLIQPDDLNDDTRLVLVNAIYFKGKWAAPFKPEDTKTEKFYLNDNDSIDVQMMHTKKKFFFKNDEALDAKVLELPYTNKDLSMIVILPNKRNGINELELKLANTDLTKITENMFRPDVIVALPKFKIETTINLEEPLTKLGLGVIFSDHADFTGMLKSPEPLKVSKVIHKAFIEVNEEGAEAAAATDITMRYQSLLINPPIKFEVIADHPFIIILQGQIEYKKLVFFRGRIQEPLHS